MPFFGEPGNAVGDLAELFAVGSRLALAVFIAPDGADAHSGKLRKGRVGNVQYRQIVVEYIAKSHNRQLL